MGDERWRAFGGWLPYGHNHALSFRTRERSSMPPGDPPLLQYDPKRRDGNREPGGGELSNKAESRDEDMATGDTHGGDECIFGEPGGGGRRG